MTSNFDFPLLRVHAKCGISTAWFLALHRALCTSRDMVNLRLQRERAATALKGSLECCLWIHLRCKSHARYIFVGTHAHTQALLLDCNGTSARNFTRMYLLRTVAQICRTHKRHKCIHHVAHMHWEDKHIKITVGCQSAPTSKGSPRLLSRACSHQQATARTPGQSLCWCCQCYLHRVAQAPTS